MLYPNFICGPPHCTKILRSVEGVSYSFLSPLPSLVPGKYCSVNVCSVTEQTSVRLVLTSHFTVTQLRRKKRGMDTWSGMWGQREESGSSGGVIVCR